MRAHIADQRGSSLVISIMVTLIMLAMAMGTFVFVEGQQRQSADERIKDSAYNLAETSLEAAVTYLTADWPDGASEPFGKGPGAPTGGPCGPSSSASSNCPEPEDVDAAFTQTGDARQADHAGAPNWRITVHDNGVPTADFYKESVTSLEPGWDLNGDDRLWVRAEAIAQGRKRVLVAQVGPSDVTSVEPLDLPMSVVNATQVLVSGAPTTRWAVDPQGSAQIPGPVIATCDQYTPPQGTSGTCPGLRPSNVQPWSMATGVDGNTCIDESGSSYAPGFTCASPNQGALIAELRTRAQAAGTYYASPSECPPDLNGKLIFLEYGYCSYTGSETYNSEDDPGMVVMAKPGDGQAGGITIGGGTTYHGLIWSANMWNATNPTGQITIQGTAKVVGAVVMDVGGWLVITSQAQPALIYNPKVFYNGGSSTSSTGGPKMVPGTFREIPTTT